MLAKTTIQKILFVDDDQDDCSIFTEIVKEIAPSLHLVCINDSEHISFHALEVKPDIIFLDMSLPSADGITSLSRLKEHEELKQIPVVIYSGSAPPKKMQEAYRCGASLFVMKPTSLQAIKETIKGILEMEWHEPEKIFREHTSGGGYRPYLT